MADEPIDPKRANIAMGLAVTRWKKLPNDPIAEKLDDPQEWVQEATLMNHFLPSHVTPLGYSFVAVTPNEFSVGIKTVRQYAGLIYKHMVPITLSLQVHELANGVEFEKAAQLHGVHSEEELAEMAGQFITGRPVPRIGGK